MRQKATYWCSIESTREHQRQKGTVSLLRRCSCLPHSDSWCHCGHEAAEFQGGLAQTQTACQHQPKRRPGPASHPASQWLASPHAGCSRYSAAVPGRGSRGAEWEGPGPLLGSKMLKAGGESVGFFRKSTDLLHIHSNTSRKPQAFSTHCSFQVTQTACELCLAHTHYKEVSFAKSLISFLSILFFYFSSFPTHFVCWHWGFSLLCHKCLILTFLTWPSNLHWSSYDCNSSSPS